MTLPRQRAKVLKPEATSTAWIAKWMEILQELAETSETQITIGAVSRALDDNNISREAIEVNLRKLTQLGWLHMSASHKEGGTFRCYEWNLR